MLCCTASTLSPKNLKVPNGITHGALYQRIHQVYAQNHRELTQQVGYLSLLQIHYFQYEGVTFP